MATWRAKLCSLGEIIELLARLSQSAVHLTVPIVLLEATDVRVRELPRLKVPVLHS